MYGRNGGGGGGYRGRGRSPRRHGRHYGYTDYGQVSSSSSQSMTSYDGAARDRSYGDQKKRSSYGYPEPEGGYRGHRGKRRPPRGQTGWRGHPGRGFKGDSTSPGRRGRPFLKQPFSPLREFTSNYFFGGGFKKEAQAWRRVELMMSEDGGQPAVKKMRKTEENSESKEPESEEDGDAEEAAVGPEADGDEEDGTQEEAEHTQSSSQTHPESPKRPAKGQFMIQFICNFCMFRTFYQKEMHNHLQSKFHKQHFSYLGKKLSSSMATFLQEHVLHKNKKTEYRRSRVGYLYSKIHHIQRNRDLTLGLGMENFMKKVDVAHCAACDTLIPMEFYSLQHHIQSPWHKKKRKIMMEKSKSRALGVAKNIIKDKKLNQKVEQFLSGQNPFLNDDDDDDDDEDDDDEDAGSDCSTELAPEGKESGEMPCITLSDSEGEEEEQVTGQKNTGDPSICEGSENTEDTASDRQ